MKRVKVINLILLIFLLACKRNRVESIDTTIRPHTHPVQLKICKLSRGFKALHGKYVEVKGKLSYNRNDTALYDNDMFPNDDMRIWLRFSQSINKEVLRKLSEKTVTIKGRVDADNKGHLNWYLATVKDIYFVQEQ